MKTCQPGCTCGKHRGRSACAAGCPCRRCYINRRKHLTRLRGKAEAHLCVDCDQQAQQWVQIKNTDGTDLVTHYQSMCISCHRAYRGWGDIMSERMTNYWASLPKDQRGPTPAARLKIAEKQRQRWAAMPDEERRALGAKIGDTQRGKPKAPQHLENIRTAAKLRQERAQAKAGTQHG